MLEEKAQSLGQPEREVFFCEEIHMLDHLTEGVKDGWGHTLTGDCLDIMTLTLYISLHFISGPPKIGLAEFTESLSIPTSTH